MSSFTSPLKTIYIGNGNYRLLESFSYRVGSPDSNWKITVPAGFETDYASFPFFLKPITPEKWIKTKASVLHDFLYRQGGHSKAIADAIFLEAMIVSGITPVAAYPMFVAVSTCGNKAYKAGVHYKPKETLV